MTLARTASQLDAGTELDDFQAAARVLLAHPLVTDAHPHPGALVAVRRFEEPLRAEFRRLTHWRLDVGTCCARLLRRPAAPAAHRPARTATSSHRAFTPWAYAYLCLLLAALERLGGQTTISQLADEVLRLRAGDDSLPVDLTAHSQRRAFVDAVAWLEERGILRLLDGDTESFLSRAGDALYDVDGDAAGRLLVSPPSVLAGLTSPDDFLAEPYPPTPEGDAARARHRLHRRLLTEPAVYHDELPEAERDFVGRRRTRIREEIERLTGCTVECRAEGMALVGAPAAEAFPGTASVAHAALLYGCELVATADDPSPAEPAGGGPTSIPGGRTDYPHDPAAATTTDPAAAFPAEGGDTRSVADATAEPAATADPADPVAGGPTSIPGGRTDDAHDPAATADPAADLAGAFPAEGGDTRSVADAMADPARRDGLPSGVGRVVDAAAADDAWRRVVAAHVHAFSADYRVEPERLRRDATELLGRLDLVRATVDGGILVRPALARYRAHVRLPETLGV